MATGTRPLPSPSDATAADPGAAAVTGRRDAGAAPAPHRSSPASWWKRGAVAAIGLGTIAYVGVADPGKAGSIYPTCPSQLLLGIDCPGCGGLRGTHALLHGDASRALDHNVLLPFLLVFCAYALVLVTAPLFGHRVRPIRPPRWAAIGLGGVLVAFTVLRNLPIAGLEWLASTAS